MEGSFSRGRRSVVGSARVPGTRRNRRKGAEGDGVVDAVTSAPASVVGRAGRDASDDEHRRREDEHDHEEQHGDT